MLVALALITGLFGLAAHLSGLGLRNWLIVLFEINAGVGALPADPLGLFNPLDIALLILVGVTFLGLWPVLAGASKILMAAAAALPFLGIMVLLATNLAGRSSVMAAGFLTALLMLKCPALKSLAYPGILANLLLLTGDFGTDSQNLIIAGLIGAGYMLLTAWFFLISLSLLKLGRLSEKQLQGKTSAK